MIIDVPVASQSPMRKTFSPIPAIIALLLLSMSTQASAKDYYVSVAGDDGAAGTFSAPFRTINHAAVVMRAKDRCLIRAGVYRETVAPLADDLEFRSFAGEPVTISGCDVVTSSWSTFREAVCVTDEIPRVMQVFLNGDRMNLARYPNQTPEGEMLSYDRWARTVTSTPEKSLGVPDVGKGLVVFSDMTNQPANYWVGGTYSGRNGPNPYSAARGEIVSSQGNSITLAAVNYNWRKNGGISSWAGSGVGYIINCLNALDAPGEWYWGAGKLYFQFPQGTRPASDLVEARTRLWGMNLNDRSNISVTGIRFQAASLCLERASNCTVSDCEILYPGPWTNYDYPTPVDYGVVGERGKSAGMDFGGPNDGSCGVMVSGMRNLIRHCRVAHSWGAGARIEGADNRIEDSLFEDLDWLGRRIGGIQLLGNRNQVVRCVIRNTGQAGIDGGNRLLGFGKVGSGLVVAGNVISRFGMITSDTGGFYINTQNSEQGVGGTVAWNTISDAGSPIFTSDIYLDNGTSGFVVHHNLVVGDRNASLGIKLNDTGSQSDILVYNNTVVGPFKNGSIVATGKGEKRLNLVLRNNLTQGSVRGGTEVDHNVTDAKAEDFRDYTRGDFRLVLRSVGNNVGIVIPKIANAFEGRAPDVGAFEYADNLGYPRAPAESAASR